MGEASLIETAERTSERRDGDDSPASRQQKLRVWLENEILDGRLRPGDRIDEQRLCARFDVSRTPVREALLQLSSLDLIEFRPRYGAIVKQMSIKEIAAMWEVLIWLEGLAAGLAARRMTAEDRARLAAVWGESRQHVTKRDIVAYDESNRKFHEIIFAGCRNEYLANQALTIRRRLKPYRRYAFQRAGGVERSFVGHQRIIEAINSGSDETANAIMRDHVAGGLSLPDLVADLPNEKDDVACTLPRDDQPDRVARLQPRAAVKKRRRKRRGK